MGIPLSPKYIPYNYMDPLGAFLSLGHFGVVVYQGHAGCLTSLTL